MQARISSQMTVEYEEAGTGRPLVLLHAFPLNPSMWQPQMDALAPHFGVEQSTFTVEQMASDVVALLDYLQIEEPVVLGGLSMGGYVAMALARQYPERVRALILADTRGEADSDEARANRNRLIEKAHDEGAGAVWNAMKGKMFSPTTGETSESHSFADATAAQQSTAQVVGALQALRDRPDAHTALATLNIPSLVLVGADDAITTPELAQALVNTLPQAKLVTIADAGHLSNLEKPQQFNAAVLQFLQSL
jgi:pimeloyl-ACP methyl ester carboxylesterase